MDIQEFTSVAEMLQLYQHFIPPRALQLSFSNSKFLMKTLEWALPIRLQVSHGFVFHAENLLPLQLLPEWTHVGTSGLVNMSYTRTS